MLDLIKGAAVSSTDNQATSQNLKTEIEKGESTTTTKSIEQMT